MYVSSKIFRLACAHFKLTVDLFASHLNHQCKHYFSFTPDLYCSYVDTFTMCWKDEKLPYMCNGISLVNKSQLTFLHCHSHSQGHWSWLHGHHFLHDAVSAHTSMPVCGILTSRHGDVKCIIKNVCKVVWAVAHVIYWTFPLV